jgi:hypothetical protein
MTQKTKAADGAWSKLGLGVRFKWCKVAYEVTSWPDQISMGGVCQMRRIGKGGKLFGPLRRFTYENCLIELPIILGKEAPGNAM